MRSFGSCTECTCELNESATCLILQAGAITGFAASFFESPIDFYKSQIQVQIIRSKTNPNYKRELRSQARHLQGMCLQLTGVSRAGL